MEESRLCEPMETSGVTLLCLLQPFSKQKSMHLHTETEQKDPWTERVCPLLILHNGKHLKLSPWLEINSWDGTEEVFNKFNLL